MSDLQLIIISMLLKKDGMYGLELVKGSNGRLKRGTIYVTLDRMEEAKLLKSELVAPSGGQRGPRRRQYRVTGEGRKIFEERMRQQADLFGIRTV